MDSQGSNGAAALAGQLAREGVEVVFGLPGDQLMHALEALAGSGIRFVVTRHEQATTFMADGYARAGGRPGVAMVVPGVGVYNAGSGLATAYASSSPVLLVAGQVPSAGIGRDLGLLHDVHDQLDLVRPVTKSARRVLDADEVAGAVHEAFVAMATGRPRPTHVEIPPDVLAAPASAPLLDAATVAPTGPDPDRVAAAAGLLLSARSPLVVTGGGVVLADASDGLRAVAEHLQAPVVDTREGKGGLDARHPLHLGTMWVNRRLRPWLDDADVVLAVGTRFAGFGLRPDQRVVQFDVDPDQIGRNHPAEIAVPGDLRLGLGALAAALAERSDPRTSREAEVGAGKRSVLAALAAIGPQFAIVDALRSGVPDDGLVVCDTTTVAYACHMAFPVHEPRSYFSTSYMGTLGAGYPTALGVKVARPDRPVVTVVGDGGFLFCAAEMATAVQHAIPTVTVLFDDGAYGNSNRDQRENYGGKEYGTLLRNPDWVQLARSFGVDAVRVDDVGLLPGAVTEACGHDGSVLIVVPIDRMPDPF
jgi:acetolactate synthase I/II/III large subunit